MSEVPEPRKVSSIASAFSCGLEVSDPSQSLLGLDSSESSLNVEWFVIWNNPSERRGNKPQKCCGCQGFPEG